MPSSQRTTLLDLPLLFKIVQETRAIVHGTLVSETETALESLAPLQKENRPRPKDGVEFRSQPEPTVTKTQQASPEDMTSAAPRKLDTDDFDEIQKQRPDASTWEINFELNLRRSPIIHLPVEILLLIMDKLELADLFMLRQVSFTFCRLYMNNRFPQPGARLDKSRFRGDEETFRRSAEVSFCTPCLQHRAMEITELQLYHLTLAHIMWCYCCDRYHPRLWFSSEERRRNSVSRECIISQGWVHLCAHHKVSLKDVGRWTGSVAEGGATPHQSLTYVRCQTCSDLAISTAATANPGYINPPTVSLCLWLQKEPSVVFHWTLPVFVVRKIDRVNDQALTAALEALKTRHGSIFCPHVNSNLEQLLRPFHPEYCSCLGPDSRVGGVVPYNAKAGRMPGAVACKDGKDVAGDYRFLPQKKPLRHIIYCKGCSTLYSWDRNNDQISLSRTSVVLAPAKDGIERDQSGMALLDPESFGVASDPVARNLIWCDDRNCANGREGGMVFSSNLTGYDYQESTIHAPDGSQFARRSPIMGCGEAPHADVRCCRF
ncbi:hypothetical protein CCHR01_04233 [Colletotrichum chrysophilum]|uniref:F-box domain-containing protein n=1 Tax=Colletotrichum chrysophilum TaxID=1836956 RepID=A0AAD9ELP3_9PEZI|nr:hypothetical protein CCHR01_04233 [Colletotrichum chrysophilum]